MSQEQKIKAGSVVSPNHAPDEQWCVLGAKDGRLCIAGWPPTIIAEDKVTLVKGMVFEIDEKELVYRRRQFGTGWE